METAQQITAVSASVACRVRGTWWHLPVAIPLRRVYAPGMRYLVASFGMLIFTGCASDRMDAEDKKFFYGGWTHPEKAAEERIMQVGSRQEVAGRRTPVGDQGSPTRAQ